MTVIRLSGDMFRSFRSDKQKYTAAVGVVYPAGAQLKGPNGQLLCVVRPGGGVDAGNAREKELSQAQPNKRVWLMDLLTGEKVRPASAQEYNMHKQALLNDPHKIGGIQLMEIDEQGRQKPRGFYCKEIDESVEKEEEHGEDEDSSADVATLVRLEQEPGDSDEANIVHP